MKFDFLNIALALVSADICFLLAQKYVHVYQLETYKPKFYLKWVIKNFATTLLLPLLVSVILYLAQNYLPVLGGKTKTLTAAFIYFIYVGIIIWRNQHMPQKKPLVYTARVKRFLIYLAVFLLAAAIFLSGFSMPYPLALFTPFIVWICAYVALPVENAISRSYFNDAKRKLEKREDLIKVGITGSFGKTSTKFIAQTILSEKFNTLATPSSFNTPMGLTRVIREQLSPAHQVFLAEMGAKHKGDIAELVGLVRPKYGVITSIAKQHLETFGDLNTITQTKYELIEGLPTDGVALFPDDEGICRACYEKTRVDKAIVGLNAADDLFMRVENIQVGQFGSRFDLICGDAWVSCETKLLGRHNIQNIVLACALAKKLGLTMEEIARGVGKIAPIEHRLQLLPTANGLIVIDDAFNANPAGVRAALEVLKAFTGQRIVVTPGMVELGDEEDAQNRAFGEVMALSCDVAILVGPKHTAPIRAGLIAKNFPEDSIHTVRTLDEASAIFGRISRPGDAILFENDLPDNYQE